MKILLIQPPSQDDFMDQVFLFEPLSLEYLAAGMLEEGHEPVILDARIDRDIDSMVKDFRPDAVGITSFTSQVNITKKTAADIRKIMPDTKIFIGGHHATVKPEDFNETYIDAVVIGEGVFTLKELMKAVTEKKDFSHIDGVGIPHPEKMILTKPRPYTPLDELPFPARYLTKQHRNRYFSEWFKPLASLRTSLGCTARCNFCSLWSITGGKYLTRGHDSVIRELKSIEEKNVFFCDDESMCSAKRMDELADRIREAGIRKNYFLYARADTIVRHPELFRKWAQIGLKQVFVGMEDFSDERLKSMKKNITTSQQEEAVKILRDNNIMMYASFMVSQDYTPADFKALKAYIRRLKLTYATFTIMTPLPGTELYHDNRHRMLSEKPELFDMLHTLLPTKMPMKDFYHELAELYKSAVPAYRLLPVIFRFSFFGFVQRLKLLGKFLNKLENAHLDY